MKKFITTKLHAVSVSVQEHSTNVENVEKVINEKAVEEANNAKILTGGIVGLQSSAAAATSLLSSSSSAVTVMTLNSPTSKQQQSSGISNSNNNGMMTAEVPPGASPQLVQQQGGGGVITISRPKPPTTGPGSGSSTAGQVKMCGYLKKKRNKMGGWRKMYFILQNQLLLSYSSKDDYEKKLAPFKDIINLVPGTVIIPTTGPRFTIETNSKVLYTFRCDDHKSCSEWITALLDSLKGDGSGDKKFSQHALHGGRNSSSGSNLQHHLTRRSLSSLSSSSSSTSSTASCYATDDPSKMAITSIRRLQQINLLHPQQQQHQQKQTSLSAPNLFYGFGSNGTGGGATASAILATSNSSHVKMGKLVQLPIAGGTARLLERGGANGQKMYKILTINEDDADDDDDDDNGENDEKPVATTTATATATTTGRSISNGNASRGDPGIKVTTAATPTPTSTTPTPKSPTEEKGKNPAVHVKSRASVDGEKATKPSGAKGAGGHRADELFNSNFRLHTNLGKMHQSIEVCRINSMFGGKKLASSSSSSSGKRLNNHGVNSKTANSDSHLAASTGDLRSIRIVGGSGNTCNNNSHNVIHNNLRGTRGGSATDLRRKPPPDLLMHSSGASAAAAMMEPKPLKDINHNNLAKWSAESITIELKANGYNLLTSGTGIKSVGSTDTLYRKLNANASTGGGRSRSNSHSSHLQQSSSSPSSPMPPPPSSSSQNRGFSSKVDLFRTLSSASASNRNDYEEIDAGGGGTMEGASPILEPIYAVVDLNVKKARRMNQLKEHDSLGTVDDGTETEEEHSIKVDMVRDKETGRLKEKSKSANVLPLGGIFGGGTNDYEELNELVMESFVNFGEDQDDSNDGENIYEPINIPEGPLTSSSTSLPSSQPTTSSSQMNNLWRNLKKMNINHLMKRSVQDQHQQQQPQQPNQRPDEDPTTKASTFGDFSKKFGHHRRSIKKKMRGLYDRGQSTEAASKITQSEEKLRKSADGSRQLMFSSFGRNKKSRKSLSFDDFIPRKKHHHHLNGVGVICKSDKANEKLHKELKRQLSKRSNSSSGGSSFIDSKNGIEL